MQLSSKRRANIEPACRASFILAGRASSSSQLYSVNGVECARTFLYASWENKDSGLIWIHCRHRPNSSTT